MRIWIITLVFFLCSIPALARPGAPDNLPSAADVLIPNPQINDQVIDHCITINGKTNCTKEGEQVAAGSFCSNKGFESASEYHLTPNRGQALHLVVEPMSGQMGDYNARWTEREADTVFAWIMCR